MKGSKLIMISAAAALMVPASALTVSKLTRGSQVSTATLPAASADKGLKSQATAMEDSHMAAMRLQVSVFGDAPAQSGPIDYATYGELVPVLEEDFSKMTSGEEGNPDFKTVTWTNNDGSEDFIPWTNMKPEFTHRPNWGAQELYCAGGTAYMDQTNDYAHINTPYDTDCSANGGICVLEFRVRPEAEDGTIATIGIEAAETRGMGPTWDIMGSQATGEVPAGWHRVQALFYGGGPTTLFNIYPGAQEGFYIDDIKVYTLKQFVATPVTLPHSEYKGTSFKANWEPVEGAEKYLVSVYTIKNDNGMQTIEYVIEDAETATNSYVAENMESGVTYYYTVKSVKGEHVSLPTMPVRVFDIVAPEMADAVVNDAEGKYTASWSAVPNAERYNYMACIEREAAADGEFVVFDEDFTGIADENGENDWSFDDPDPEALTYDDLYPAAGLNQQGWHIKHGINYKNSVCIDGWWYMAAQQDAGLISPDLDLSKDGGKATLTLTLAGEYIPADVSGFVDADGNPVACQAQAAVAVFNYNEKTQDYDQAELIYANSVNPAGVCPTEWRTFTFPITKGTERTIIGIYAVGAPGNLFVNDMKLVQNYKAGEKFMDPFLFKHWYEGNEVEVSVPARTIGNKVYHKVSCTRSMADPEEQMRALFAESEFSPLKEVYTPTFSGIGTHVVDSETAVALDADGNLFVTAPAGAFTGVYTLDGQTVFSGQTGGNVCVTLPAKGVYVVKAGEKTVKVIF